MAGLILDPGTWSKARLIKQVVELNQELRALDAMLSMAPPVLPNPWAVDTARRIVAVSISLADSVLVPNLASRELLASTVNQLYECRNAIPYLVNASRAPPPALPPPPGRRPGGADPSTPR